LSGKVHFHGSIWKRENYLKTENIYSGLIVKNYKKMCALLNEKETTGEAKQIQLKKWKRYFEFEKAGQKFIIGTIREKPLPEEVRKGSVYVEKIEKLMQHNFSGKKDGTWVVTSKELYVTLGMTSPRFRELGDDEENIACFVEKLHVSGLSVFDFRGRAKVELSRILHDALESMNKRGVMKWEKKYHISTDTESFVADQKQTENIEAVQKQVRNELGCKLTKDVYMKNQQKQYYEHVAQKLKENYSWDKVYLYHHFEFEPRKRTYSLHEVSDLKTELNEAIVRRIEIATKRDIVQAKRLRYETSIDDEGQYWGELPVNKRSKRTEPKYYKEQEILISYFIQD